MRELLTTLGWLVIVYAAYRLGREDGRIRALNGRGHKPSVEQVLRRDAARGEWRS